MDRQEVLDEVKRRIDAAGGSLVQPAKSLADELGVKHDRMYDLLRAFTKEGQLTVTNRGQKGSEFQVGGGVPVAAASSNGRRRTGAGSTGRGAARAGRATPRSRVKYCPWCGHATESDWRFCGACGKRLPGAR